MNEHLRRCGLRTGVGGVDGQALQPRTGSQLEQGLLLGDVVVGQLLDPGQGAQPVSLAWLAEEGAPAAGPIGGETAAELVPAGDHQAQAQPQLGQAGIEGGGVAPAQVRIAEQMSEVESLQDHHQPGVRQVLTAPPLHPLEPVVQPQQVVQVLPQDHTAEEHRRCGRPRWCTVAETGAPRRDPVGGQQRWMSERRVGSNTRSAARPSGSRQDAKGQSSGIGSWAAHDDGPRSSVN